MAASDFFANTADEVKAEIERIERALREPQTADRYCQLYAAQQALVWAWDPARAAAPYRTIQLGKVQPLATDIPEGSEGYSAVPHRLPSSDTCSRIC